MTVTQEDILKLRDFRSDPIYTENQWEAIHKFVKKYVKEEAQISNFWNALIVYAGTYVASAIHENTEPLVGFNYVSLENRKRLKQALKNTAEVQMLLDNAQVCLALLSENESLNFTAAKTVLSALESMLTKQHKSASKAGRPAHHARSLFFEKLASLWEIYTTEKTTVTLTEPSLFVQFIELTAVPILTKRDGDKWMPALEAWRKNRKNP